MKIAVLQQYAPVKYNRKQESPTLGELKACRERSTARCLELVAEAASMGADMCVTVETVNAYLALGDTRFEYEETLEGDTVQRFRLQQGRTRCI